MSRVRVKVKIESVKVKIETVDEGCNITPLLSPKDSRLDYPNTLYVCIREKGVLLLQ
jgi:hypothetical protein